jgi:site-specific DNA-methyltransferase (adenine-specific)/site-specific DNA-methyltransferase (cytosine-N4-specific)|tara:strand:- start:674 stop:1510 length:837 start_codon:yes stop_codon:yes gene_type:complete
VNKYINKIITGDSLQKLSNKEIFPDNSIDLIITSPPYADRRANTHKSSEYVEWFLPIAEQLKRILKPNGSFILNIKENVAKHERQTYTYELLLELKEQGWMWREEYCWYKNTSFPGYWPKRFRDNWERIYHFSKDIEIKFNRNAVKVPIGKWAEKRFNGKDIEHDKKRHVSKTGSGLSREVNKWKGKKEVDPHNVLEFTPVTNNINHSAAYPVYLPLWFIKLLSKKGDLILDPFMGSGTTAIAALELERKYIGIEIQASYSKVARKRIKEYKKSKIDS